LRLYVYVHSDVEEQKKFPRLNIGITDS